MSLIFFILALGLSPILFLMAFIFPLNILAVCGQLLLTLLVIYLFRRKKRKGKKRIFIFIPTALHVVFLAGTLFFAGLSFTQHEENDVEKITLGIRRFLSVKAGMDFLAPTTDEIAKMNQQQVEMKQKSQQESLQRRQDQELRENTKVEILDEE